MTDKLMFDTWAHLLRPLFPPGAVFTFKSRRRLICIDWIEDDEPGRANRSARAMVIAFTQLGWRTYRGARSTRRARADANLTTLVQAGLAQAAGEDNAYDFTGGELRIKVASIDLFPPSSTSAQRSGLSLSAG